MRFQESLEDLTKANADTTAERKYLEDQIVEMKEELKLKNDKIEQLERILNTKKESVSTQTRKSQPAAMRLVGRRVSPAKSLHNISISHVAASTPGQWSVNTRSPFPLIPVVLNCVAMVIAMSLSH